MSGDTFNFLLIFQAGLAVSLLGSIYYCLKNRAASRLYWNFGKNLASTFILVEVLLLLASGAIISATFLVPFHFLSVALSVMGGMLLARRLAQPSLPILSALTRPRQRSVSTYLPALILNVSFFSILICAFTFVLFKATRPEISDFLKPAVEDASTITVQAKVNLGSVVFFTLVAFYEEIVFRLFLQTLFGYWLRKLKGGQFLAVAIASVIFAVGHFGVLETWWVKFVQTFFIGLALGYLMKRRGMETSFATHTVLNIFALYSSDILLK